MLLLVYKLSLFMEDVVGDSCVLLALCCLGLEDLASSHLERGNFLFVHVACLRDAFLLGHVGALLAPQLGVGRDIELLSRREAAEDRASIGNMMDQKDCVWRDEMETTEFEIEHSKLVEKCIPPPLFDDIVAFPFRL